MSWEKSRTPGWEKVEIQGLSAEREEKICEGSQSKETLSSMNRCHLCKQSLCAAQLIENASKRVKAATIIQSHSITPKIIVYNLHSK